MTWYFHIAVACWSVICLCAGMLIIIKWHNHDVKRDMGHD